MLYYPLCLDGYTAEVYKKDDSVLKPKVKTEKYPVKGQVRISHFITNIPI